MPSPQTIIIIPARLSSQRLPNKVLLDLAGKPIIQRVYEQAKKAKAIDEVFIATDSQQVQVACQTFTHNIIMTRSDHPSGTDRIAEAAQSLEAEVIINVQGDEPFVDPQLIEQLALLMQDARFSVGTAVCRITAVADFLNPNIVKAVVDEQKRALYFSRSPVPFPRDTNLATLTTLPPEIQAFRHLGIYAYQRNFLLHYATLPPTHLEKTEKLEQLRVLENGYPIGTIETTQPSLGIDTEEDLTKARILAPNFFTNNPNSTPNS